MQSSSRDALVITLSAVAASLDAWSFFGLGHVFVANMTGNTVLLGFSIFTGARPQVIASGLSLVCYACGVFLGALFARPIRRQMAVREAPEEQLRFWPRRATHILGLECLLVVLAAGVSLLHTPVRSSPLALMLIGIVAFSVGLQSATINAMKLPGVATTYITGTWTLLSSGLAQLVNGEKTGRERRQWAARLRLEAMVLLSYFGAALFSGLIYHFRGAPTLGAWSATMLILVLGGISFTQASKTHT